MNLHGTAVMNKGNILIVPLLLLASLFGACGSSGDGMVATIGDYKLSLKEYERQYLKNNGGRSAADTSTLAGRMDFLDLLVKYRLKVLEARALGYDKDPEIIKELDEYRNSLAVPYLTEREVIDPQIKKLHERRQQEVRAAHILLRTQQDSLGNMDTASVYAQAVDLLRQARSGVPFDTLAARWSQDPGSAKNGGELMYFTAGMTVPAFDDAVYSLKPGEIYPRPIRTLFGYHLVKLLDKRTTRGEIEVSHILVRIPPEKPDDTTAAYAKISSIADTLRRGGDFAKLARMNSEDQMSGEKGGDLGWGGRRRFVPEFELVAFEMSVGQVSDVVRTPFGYHIIKVTGERPAKPFDEMRQELKQIYQRYGFEEDNRAFLSSIEAKHGIKISEPTVERMAQLLDTSSTTAVAGWHDPLTEDVRSMTLVTLRGGAVTVGDAITTIDRNRDLQSKPLNRASLRELAQLLGQKEAMARETADLEKRYPEFGELMQEYREGVLLFRAEQEAVWNRVAVRDTALKEFWERHRAEYAWPDRVSFREIFVTSDSLGKVLRDSLNHGVDFAELASRHTQRAGYKEKGGDWGLQVETVNDLSRKAITMQPGWIEGPFRNQYGWSIIRMEGREAAREKTFEEAQSEVSSKFQEFEHKRLEKEWIDSLRRKFGVSVNEGALRNAFGGGRSAS